MKRARANCPEVRVAAIDTLKPYLGHARHHDKQQRRKVEASIRAYGQITPLIVDQSGTIIDGHLVYGVMRDLGYDEIVVVVVSGRSEAEIRALRLALNRIPQDAGWDREKLRAELQYLIEVAFDVELTGFSAVEIDHIVDVSEADADTELPALAPDAVSRPGDIWVLGQHHVGCGDALDGAFVAKTLAGAKPSMAFVDPPYNVRIDGFVSGSGSTRHREFAMASGEMSEAQFTVFLASALAVLKASVAPGAVTYACMDWRHVRELLNAAHEIDLELINLCVWAKTTPGLGSFYRSQHELVAVFKAGEEESRNNMSLVGKRRNRSNLWTYRGMNSFGDGRDELVKLHPTVKPAAMIADAIRDVSLRGEAVLDTFLGSGTSLIAAEETGRVCFGTEIDPWYIDVAIRRWQQETKRDAVLLETGEIFLETSERRAKPAGEVEHA